MENLTIIQDKIYEIRGQKVMLDFDLAGMYQVETKALKQAVKRNNDRFPSDFMFQLTKQETDNLRSQFVTSSWGDSRYQNFVFTEQGVSMLSSVLRSDIAVKVSIAIMRAFVQMRANFLQSKQVTAELDDLRCRMQLVEQSLVSMGNQPLNTAEPLPEYLSETIQVYTYSERALVILTCDVNDRRLLEAIGARYNRWLTLHGDRIAGWIYPKRRLATLLKYVPESVKERQRKNTMS